jgi:hypothetical protein
VRGLAFLLLVLAIASTAAGAFGLAFSFFEDQAFLVPSLALMVVPWALWVPVRRRATAEGRAQFEAALSAIEPETANWYDGSGLALDRANGKLVVGSRGQVAVHALGDLTEVEFVPESAGSVSAAGVSNAGVLGAILALFAIGSATSGHLGSGLFLTLGGRKWQVFGVDMEEAKLWIAELRQVAPQAVFKEPQ